MEVENEGVWNLEKRKDCMRNEGASSKVEIKPLESDSDLSLGHW
jgi:hypothetical protein